MRQLADAELVAAPQHDQHTRRAKSAKPIRLVKVRQQHKAHAGLPIAPNAIVVYRSHVEGVISGTHVCVVCSAARAGVHPVLVKRFEPVLEMQFFRSGEAQGCKAKIECVIAGWYGSVSVPSDRELVGPRLLEHHGRWKAITCSRVNSHHAAQGRKPYPSIASYPTSRAPTIGFGAPHAFRGPVRYGRKERDLRIGKVIELRQ